MVIDRSTASQKQVQQTKLVEKQVGDEAKPTERLTQFTAEMMTGFVPDPIKDYIERKIDAHIEHWLTLNGNGIQRRPIALIGGAGSGKNTAVENYAAKHKLPLLVIPCDDSQVLKELLGFWKAEEGSTFWCEGLLSQFLRFPCVLFDEVNCLPAGKLFMLHELFQGRKIFLKDAPADMALIKLHNEVRLCMAMNPPEAKYSGTNRLNTALANRTSFIQVPAFKDSEILQHSTKNAKLDQEIVHFYKEASRMINEQHLRVSISKRNIDSIAAAVRDGMDIGTAVMEGFVNCALATADVHVRDALKNVAINVFGGTAFYDIVKND